MENKDLNFEFEIPPTPENLKAFEKLRREFMNETLTIYRKDKEGSVFPMANISKHPNCSADMFKKLLDKIAEIELCN